MLSCGAHQTAPSICGQSQTKSSNRPHTHTHTHATGAFSIWKPSTSNRDESFDKPQGQRNSRLFRWSCTQQLLTIVLVDTHTAHMSVLFNFMLLLYSSRHVTITILLIVRNLVNALFSQNL